MPAHLRNRCWWHGGNGQLHRGRVYWWWLPRDHRLDPDGRELLRCGRPGLHIGNHRNHAVSHGYWSTWRREAQPLHHPRKHAVVNHRLICQVIAVVIFAVAAVLGFGWLGSGGPDVLKLLAITNLGLAFHAVAHL